METNTFTPDVACEVLPRGDASSDDLRALAHWSETELRAGLLDFIDNIVLFELLGGDDPTEVVFAVLYGEDSGDCLTITRRAPVQAERPEAFGQLVVACTFRGSSYDRQRVIQSLRSAIPAALVDDIVLDGRSWNAP